MDSTIELACNDNPELKDSWMYTDSKDGFTISLTFEKKGGDCSFDCKALFPTFADSDACKYLFNRVVTVV